MEKIIEGYRNHLYNLGYSKKNQKGLPGMATEFLTHQGIRDIAAVSQQQVKDFYEYLHVRPNRKREGGISEGTIQQYVDGLRNFFKWLEITGQSSYNPISGCRFKRGKAISREPLTVAEVSALFDAACNLEEKALLHLCYSCGLRRGEAVALNIRDLHFRERLLYVREGKNHKRRVIPMTEQVAGGLENYYAEQRSRVTQRKHRDDTAFMVNGWGTRMRGKEYNYRLKLIVTRAGIDKPEISLHHLRHSIATHLLQGGMQMVFVKDFLGHGYLNTTQIYAKANQKQLLSL